MDLKTLAAYFDHTLLKAPASESDIRQLCQEAREWGFASVCVNPSRVPLASRLLKGSSVKVCTVVGFPLGATTTLIKREEARHSVHSGAQEIDMVVNLGWIADQAWDKLKNEIHQVVEASGDTIVKVILETCLWDKREIQTACRCAEDAGAHFVKTSTGFSLEGARIEQVEWMRSSVSNRVGVKASGGIKTLEQTLNLIQAGASRIGSSSSVSILKDFLLK
ncbi:MAG: deoxyribose-phosphate aldolase [Spirochaetales bacterium]|nr:deoxyribose-phosphate aldolase [Spirochaetales bacterium]